MRYLLVVIILKNLFILLIIIIFIAKRAMNIFDFIKQFFVENACRLRFKELRDNICIVCDKWICSEHYWHENKLCYECKHCHHRKSLRSGTVMQSSKLPFRY